MLDWSVPGHLCIYYDFQYSGLLGLRMSRSSLGLLFFCLFILPNINVLILLLSYYIYLVIFYYYPLEVCLFSNETIKGMELDERRYGEELEIIEE